MYLDKLYNRSSGLVCGFYFVNQIKPNHKFT